MEWLIWIIFGAFVILSLVLDTEIFKSKRSPNRDGNTNAGVANALIMSAFWIALAMAFGVLLYFYFGGTTAMEYYACYLLEKGLSIDNIFVFHVIFEHFQVPLNLQKPVLKWGIIGALLMRAAFISMGIQLLHRLHFIIFIFGGLLVYTGVKLIMEQFGKDSHHNANSAFNSEIANAREEVGDHYVFSFIKRYIPYTDDFHKDHFFVKKSKYREGALPMTSDSSTGSGGYYATKLFMALVCVEIMDAIFALDSIPAILSLTDNALVMYTSNICAILGLRALFFAVSSLVHKFKYLQGGLALILLFVGGKMLISGYVHVPLTLTLFLIVFIMAGSIVLSVLSLKPDPKKDDEARWERNPQHVLQV